MKKITYLISLLTISIPLLANCNGGGSKPIEEVTLTNLEASPTITSGNYPLGYSFSKHDINVTATYSDGSIKTVSDNDYTLSVDGESERIESYVFRNESSIKFNVSYLTKTSSFTVIVKNYFKFLVDGIDVYKDEKNFRFDASYIVEKGVDDVSYTSSNKEIIDFDSTTNEIIVNVSKANGTETVQLYANKNEVILGKINFNFIDSTQTGVGYKIYDDHAEIYANANDRTKEPITVSSRILTSGKFVTGLYYDSANSLGAFEGCSALTSITLPITLTEISTNAFKDCTSLKEIYIPQYVEKIDITAFSGCTSLEKIEVDPNNSKYSSVDGILFSKSKANLLAYPQGKKDESYNIEKGTSIIGAYAFANCQCSFISCNNVEFISKYAFIGAKSTLIGLNDGVRQISEGAFKDCTKLSSITIPNSVTTIEKSAFEGCNEELTINFKTDKYSSFVWEIGGVKELVNYSEIKKNTERLVKKGEQWIKGEATTLGLAFEYSEDEGGYLVYKDRDYTSKLDSTLIIPDEYNGKPVVGFNFFFSLTGGAFCNCEELKYVIIPNTFKEIEMEAFAYCTNLETVILPESLTKINERAFLNCNKLSNITIPSTVTSIGEAAFAYCSSLKSITIPDGVTTIYDYTFTNTSLETLDLNKVKYVKSHSFASFDYTTGTPTGQISSITGNNLCEVEMGAFAGNSKLESFNIPNSLTSLCGSAFYCCNKLIKFEINDDHQIYKKKEVELAEGVKGEILYGRNNPESEYTKLISWPWASGAVDLTTLDPTIFNSITEISEGCFAGSDITSIKFSKNIDSIGDCAFTFCTKLKNFDLSSLSSNTKYKAISYNNDSNNDILLEARDLAPTFDTILAYPSATGDLDLSKDIFYKDNIDIRFIASYTFAGNCYITSIKFGKNFTRFDGMLGHNIDIGAFSHCYNLKELDLSLLEESIPGIVKDHVFDRFVLVDSPIIEVSMKNEDMLNKIKNDNDWFNYVYNSNFNFKVK